MAGPHLPCKLRHVEAESKRLCSHLSSLHVHLPGLRKHLSLHVLFGHVLRGSAIGHCTSRVMSEKRRYSDKYALLAALAGCNS